jgi:ribonuclease VapC
VIVVDASAVVAIVQNEPGYERLVAKLAAAHPRHISSVSWVEVTLALMRSYRDAAAIADDYMRRTNITIHPIDDRQASLSRAAYLRYGKGRHPARLNLGDCFSYAAAKSLNAPLLYVGGDFAKTDVKTA